MQNKAITEESSKCLQTHGCQSATSTVHLFSYQSERFMILVSETVVKWILWLHSSISFAHIHTYIHTNIHIPHIYTHTHACTHAPSPHTQTSTHTSTLARAHQNTGRHINKHIHMYKHCKSILTVHLSSRHGMCVPALGRLPQGISSCRQTCPHVHRLRSVKRPMLRTEGYSTWLSTCYNRASVLWQKLSQKIKDDFRL